MRGVFRAALALTGILVVASGCNEQGLQGTIPHIVVDPQQLDLGRHEQGVTGIGSVSVTNIGSQPLEIYELSLVPAGPFSIVSPAPTNEAPVTLGPNDLVDLEIAFTPLTAGEVSSELHIRNNDPNEQVVRVDLDGRGFYVQTDYFTQPALVDQADILFVVDNSGSMYDEQVLLGNGFATFIDWIAGTVVDFQIAVTATDELGSFYGTTPVIDPSTPNIEATFASNVQVGTNGAYFERGFASAKVALENNPTFLRPTAQLYLMFVSDEDDQSGGSVLSWVDYFADLKGGRERVFFSSISGPPTSACQTADSNAAPGPRYHYISNLGQGHWGSICQTDFGHSLLQLGFAVSGLYGEFELSQPATADTARVWVDDVPADPADFHLDAGTNSIVFTAAALPPAGSSVRVSYEVDTPN